MIKRGMCCLCVSFMLGILYGRDGRWWLVAVLLLLLAIMAAVMRNLKMPAADKASERGQTQKMPNGSKVSEGVQYSWMRIGCVFLVRAFLCVILFAAGLVHMQEQQEIRGRLEEVLSDDDDVTVVGRISEKEETDTQSSRSQVEETVSGAQTFQKKQFIYYLRDTHILSEGRSYPCHGVLVYSSNGQYQPGNVLKADGRYMPFQISRNEGNFNEKQYQQSRKWEFRLFSDGESALSRNEDRFAVLLNRLRVSMKDVFVNTMDAEDAGLMASMTLGDRSFLEPEIKKLYQDAGISHVLAISGLHVSILGMGLLSLLQRLGCHRKWCAVFAAAIVCSFCVFSGMEVSTVRAVGMFLLMMAAQVLGYSYDSVTALFLSAAVQLWGNPFLTEYAGFLFSYGAVLGVVVVWKIIRSAQKEQLEEKKRKEKKRKEKQKRQRWQEVLQCAKNKVCGIIWVSVCIQLVTLPLTLYFYYEIPSYSIFVNVCILPFMGILLFLGFLGGLLGIWFPGLGAVILTPGEWLLTLNKIVCIISGRLPWANFIAGKPSLQRVLVYYVALGICLYFIWRRKEKRYLAGMILIFSCLLFVRGNAQFEIDVLDVGQGDGIFIQNDNGEHFFVDGGSSDVSGVGEYRILPFLKSRGIHGIKGWIVSHADADHISGLLELLQQGYPVETLILAEYMVKDEAMETLVQAAEKAGCEVLYVSPGMKFGSGNLVFTALAPKENGTDRNASSLSMLLEHSGFRGVFTGDIGQEQEMELAESGNLARYGAGNVDFYKAAHHGSDYSNSQKFLEMIFPKMTVVSCAEKNTYGHPGREAMERIQKTGSRIFLTMDQGQIRVRQEREGIRVWTYLP